MHKNQEIQKVSPPRSVVARRAGVGFAALSGMALAHLAGADGIDTLTSAATSGASGLSTAVLTIAGVAVTIGLAWWAATKLKPKGG